jgi:DNA polymerase I-like protein with 3'-5' exonuclease and polymerase domains
MPHYGEGEHKGIPDHLTSVAKSILGDDSDNYGGVKGLGPAKFTELLELFGEDGVQQLQEVVASGNTELLDMAIEQTGNKVLIKLRDNFADWRLMWRLANLRPELCWKPRAKKLVTPTLHKRVPNAQRTYTLLQQAGCSDLWDTVFAAVLPNPIAITADNWAEMKDAIFAEIAAGDITAFDYESANKDPIAEFVLASTQGDKHVDVLSQQLAGASFQFGRHLENVIYVPVDHANSPNLPAAVIAEILEYAGSCTRLVAQNAFFEGVVSQTNLNLALKNVHDTRIMQRYVNENMEAGLKAMSLHYLGYEQATYEETLAAAGVERMDQLTLEQVFSYGADDALVTGHLYDLLKLLLQLDNQWAFYEAWAVNPTVVLQHSYIKGVDINWSLQERLHKRDLATVETGMVELRQILEANVSGQITDGCRSLIEADKDFVFRSAKKKAEGDAEVARLKVYEWSTKQEAACQYLPYRTELVMPSFALTPKQLTTAALAIGLPEVEKVSAAYLSEYLANHGMAGFEPQLPEDPAQAEFLQALATGIAGNMLKVKNLADKAIDGDERAQERADAAQAALEAFGAVVQRLSGVVAKEITFGDELNPNSPAQMQQLLYCKIGVPVRLRGKAPGKGRLMLGITEAGPSTDETAVLTAIANDIERGSWQHKALEVLLKVKSAQTRISLYHDKLPLWKHRDGKVHPSITDAGTDTRRPTGSSPNILQVSKKDKELRSMYVPPSPDHVVVSIDYNGQELRIMACESGDPVMIDAYDPQDEKDLHSVTGSGVAQLKAPKAVGEEAAALRELSDFRLFDQARSEETHPLTKLATAIRKKAKGVNFGLGYGAGAPTLSRNLIVPLDEAEQLLEGALVKFARIRPWQSETASFMEKNGFTLTAFGTKRHATDDIFAKDRGKVARQHRQGTNATIQGTAAEMLRIVLTGIVERGLLERLNMVFFAPIYDETVAFVHKDDVAEYCREMNEIMAGATPPSHAIPQCPEFSIGPDWGRVHELGRYPGDDAINAMVARSIEEARPMWDEINGYTPKAKEKVAA